MRDDKNLTLLVTRVFLGLGLVSVAISVVFSVSYVRSMRELRSLQAQMSSVANTRQVIQAVVSESIEYSKRNPAIDPILQGIGVKPRPAGSPAPTKGGK